VEIDVASKLQTQLTPPPPETASQSRRCEFLLFVHHAKLSCI